MNKKLPIGDAPIKYLLRFYIPLMISFLNPDEVKGWFYSSYILTKVRKRTYKLWMVFQNFNPFVLRFPCFFLSSLLTKKTFLTKIVKVLINHDYYISLSLDFFYLNNSFCFGNTHFNHSVLLYGYDEQCGIVNLCGYCFDPKIKCVDVEVNNFINSFYSCKHNKAWIYKRRKRKAKSFNKRFFYLGVKGYATASCPLEYQIRAKSFSCVLREHYGIDAHKQLKSDLKCVLNGENKNLKLRIYSYLELSQCMVKRLEYIQDNKVFEIDGEIIKGFRELTDEYNSMLNMFLKFDLTQNSEIIKRLIVFEDEISEKEKALYIELYQALKRQRKFT